MSEHWTFDSDRQLAVYFNRYYNKQTLHLAIENVKKNREWYATYEAFIRDLNHFERGLSVFMFNESKT